MGFAGGLKGTFPCPSFSEEQEEQNDYRLRFKTGRDGVAFRNATNAKPRRPVPRSKRLLGSGTAVLVPLRVTSLIAKSAVVSSVAAVRLKVAQSMGASPVATPM
jgi:hypothetical protein